MSIAYNTQEHKVLQMIKSVIESNKELLKGYRVVLFGSRAGNVKKKRSDFDLGIIGDKPMDILDFYKIKDALDELPTLYQIDLVDFSKVSDNFKNEALKNIKVIYGED